MVRLNKDALGNTQQSLSGSRQRSKAHSLLGRLSGESSLGGTTSARRTTFSYDVGERRWWGEQWFAVYTNRRLSRSADSFYYCTTSDAIHHPWICSPADSDQCVGHSSFLETVSKESLFPLLHRYIYACPVVRACKKCWCQNIEWSLHSLV